MLDLSNFCKDNEVQTRLVNFDLIIDKSQDS